MIDSIFMTEVSERQKREETGTSDAKKHPGDPPLPFNINILLSIFQKSQINTSLARNAVGRNPLCHLDCIDTYSFHPLWHGASYYF